MTPIPLIWLMWDYVIIIFFFKDSHNNRYSRRTLITSILCKKKKYWIIKIYFWEYEIVELTESPIKTPLQYHKFPEPDSGAQPRKSQESFCISVMETGEVEQIKGRSKHFLWTILTESTMSDCWTAECLTYVVQLKDLRAWAPST